MDKVYLLDVNPSGDKSEWLSRFRNARSFKDLNGVDFNSLSSMIEKNRGWYLCKDSFTTKYVYDEVNDFLEYMSIGFNSLVRSKYRRISKGGWF